VLHGVISNGLYNSIQSGGQERVELYLTVSHMAWCINKQWDKRTFVHLFICSIFDGSVSSSGPECRTGSA